MFGHNNDAPPTPPPLFAAGESKAQEPRLPAVRITAARSPGFAAPVATGTRTR